MGVKLSVSNLLLFIRLPPIQFVWEEIIFEIEIICNVISPYTKCTMVGATLI